MEVGGVARSFLRKWGVFDEGRSQGVLAARDAPLQAPRGGGLAPLTAHPAMLGTSKNTRFNVSSASAHVLTMARTLSDCIATISREEMRLTTGAALPVPSRLGVMGSQVWILGLGVLSNIRCKEIPRTGDCPMGSIPPAKIVQETDLIPTAYARSSFLHLSTSWRFRLSINRFWPLTSKCF